MELCAGYLGVFSFSALLRDEKEGAESEDLVSVVDLLVDPAKLPAVLRVFLCKF